MAVNELEPGGDQEDTRIAQLYREASIDEPPARLHAAVRAAARGAVDGRSTEKPSSWWTLWRVPFAVAAVAVVSASLVTLVMEESGERVAEVTAPAPRHDEERPSTAEPESNREILADAPVADKQRRSPPAAHRSPSPAVMPPSPLSESAPASQVEHEQALTPLALGQGSAVALPTPEADTRPSTEPKMSTGSVRERAAMRAAPATAPATRADRAEAARQSPPDIAALKTELEKEPPARWIERIGTLRREGRRLEADALLAEFKRRYPEELVPSAIQ